MRIKLVSSILWCGWMFFFCAFGIAFADDDVQRRANEILKKQKATGKARWFDQGQLVNICRFIEEQKNKTTSMTYKKYSSSTTHLPCDIECYPELHGYIIRDSSRERRVGTGCHKTVRSAIYYGKSIKLVADCDSDKTARGEIRTLRRLQGQKGIVPYLGYVKRKDRYSIFLEYFAGGSIRQRFYAKYHFSNEQALKIAKDLIQGLRSMHQRKLIHRDLHDGNALLRPTHDGLFEAALVDFGKTIRYDKAGSQIPQGARFRSPPEGLITRFRKLDRFAVDVFALGCTLYEVVFGKVHPWVHVYNAYHVDELSRKERIEKFRKIASIYNAAKREHLTPIIEKSQNKVKLQPIDRLKILVFAMTNYQPKRRPTILQAERKMQQIAPQY